MTFIILVLSISILVVLLASNTTRSTVAYTSDNLPNGSSPSPVNPMKEEPEQSELSVHANQFSIPTLREFSVPSGSRPHDVAPVSNVTVWYTAQGSGELGRLNPTTNETHHISLGQGSAPHGVIVGPDGAPRITDGGLNAIVRVDPDTEEVKLFPLPEEAGNANLNTATFDHSGTLWFTGQSGIYGRLDPSVGQIQVFDAPRGRGPYGISTTLDGSVYYASLAGSYKLG